MPEIKNSFLKGKMNKDHDDRLVPKGEYREAQNLIIGESEDSDIGALENLLGNKIPYGDVLTAGTDFSIASNVGNNSDIIGYVRDIKNNRIIFFITNFSGESDSTNIRTMPKANNLGSDITSTSAYDATLHYCGIYVYRGDQNDVKKLVTGAWLNFSKNHLITGVSILENMLFWTDNYNQPRKLNIDSALNNYTSASAQYYLYEEQISVAKVAPWEAIRLTDCGQPFIGDNKTRIFALTTDYFATLPTSETQFDVYVNGYLILASDYEYSSPNLQFNSNTNTPNGGNHLSDTGAPLTSKEILVKKKTIYSNETHIDSQYLKEKFVRFSYRYKYEDGEYSTTAPFTQAVFEPLNDAYLDYLISTSTNDVSISDVIKTTKVKLMENQINQVEMRIPLPELNETSESVTPPTTWDNTFNITNIEILAKESDSPAVKVVADIKVNTSVSSTFMDSIESYFHKPTNGFNMYIRATGSTSSTLGYDTSGDNKLTIQSTPTGGTDYDEIKAGQVLRWDDSTMASAFTSLSAVDYQFSTTTTDSDPGGGYIRFNSADLAGGNVSYIYMDDADAGTTDRQVQYLKMKNQKGDHTGMRCKGFIRIADNGSSTNYTQFKVKSVTEATGYWKFEVWIPNSQQDNGEVDSQVNGSGGAVDMTNGSTKDITFYEIGDGHSATVVSIAGNEITTTGMTTTGGTAYKDKQDDEIVTFLPQYHYRQVCKFLYRSEEPYKVIPEDQLTRVYDQVPLRAKAQEISGNRVIYGNYTENYPHPTDEYGNKGVNFVAAHGRKSDNEHADTAGYLQWLQKQYKFHSAKQRRTYQVGLVLADRFGRQSPVLLSTNQLQPSPVTLAEDQGVNDSYTIPNISENLARKFDENGDGTGDTYSWSTLQEVFGACLDIEFMDPSGITQSLSEVFNNTTGTGYNPHGWYSYRVVVKQTEQDYYNVYCSHPADSWNSIDNKRDITRTGRSWLSLYGDNINKVPRDVKTQDETREGLSSSDTRLFPKVISAGSQDPVGYFRHLSRMNDLGVQGTYGDRQKDLIDVISLGSAKDQGLYFSGDRFEGNPDYGTSGFNIVPFIYGKKKSPLIAELPNLSSMYNTHNPAGVKGTVQASTGTFGTAPLSDPYGSATFKVSNDLENATYGMASGDDVDDIAVQGTTVGFKLAGTNIKPELTENDITVTDYSYGSGIGTVTISQFQSVKRGDEIYFSGAKEGLTIFETEPFESKLDIYWETSTCGLIKELNTSVADAAADAPTNIGWDTSSPLDGTADATNLNIEEGTAQGSTIGNIAATGALSPAGSMTYEMIYFKDNYGVEHNSKVYVQGTGAVQTANPGGGFYHSNTSYDNWLLRVRALESGGTSTTDNITLGITNTRPICGHEFGPGATALESTYEKPATGTAWSFDFSNSTGAQDPAKFADNLTVSHNFTNNTDNNSLFTSTMLAGTVTFATSGDWNASTAAAFYAQTSAQRTVAFTITDLDGAGLTNTPLCETIIAELMTRYSQDLKYDADSCAGTNESGPGYGGAICDDTTAQYYVSQGTTGDIPSGTTLYVSNIIYRGSSGSGVAPNGYYVLGNTCYTVSSSGVIASTSGPFSCYE